MLPPISEVIQVPEPLTSGTHEVSKSVVVLREKIDPRLTQIQPRLTAVETKNPPIRGASCQHMPAPENNPCSPVKCISMKEGLTSGPKGAPSLKSVNV